MASTWHKTGKVYNLSNECTPEKNSPILLFNLQKVLLIRLCGGRLQAQNQTFYGPSILLAKKS